MLIQIAGTLNLMLVKPKCVWKVLVHKSCKQTAENCKRTAGSEIFIVIAIWISKFLFGSPCIGGTLRKLTLKLTLMQSQLLGVWVWFKIQTRRHRVFYNYGVPPINTGFEIEQVSK